MRRLAALLLSIGTLAVQAEDATDPGTMPVGSLDIVARLNDPGPSGVVVLPNGRIFLSFPRHAENHQDATLAELVSGKRIPFPNAAMSLPSNRPLQDQLVSVHGMTTDSQGRLWVIDDGKRAGVPGIPLGAAKVVGFDPATGHIVGEVILKPPVLLPDSHMNDLRVDLTHGAKGTAYITDSSFGTSPALVVVDLATGKQRRVLAGHVSTRAVTGFLASIDGLPLRYDPKHPRYPIGGADAITMSTDSRTLYYAPLTSRRLYSIPTEVLSNFNADESMLEAAVSDEGEKGFADGMATDPMNRLYTTNSEHDAIWRRWPDGHFDVVLRDPRVLDPDGIYVTDKYVYVVAGQWERLPGFNDGKNLRRPPYLLLRAPIDTPSPIPAATTAARP